MVGKAKRFDVVHSAQDMQSEGVAPPPGARLVVAPGMYGGRYVPVSFVAKDWGVSSRRIRYLLIEGRLLGLQRDNGYWEVHYPYAFTFGTRGPGLKRQKRPSKVRPNNVVKLERKEE